MSMVEIENKYLNFTAFFVEQKKGTYILTLQVPTHKVVKRIV